MRRLTSVLLVLFILSAAGAAVTVLADEIDANETNDVTVEIPTDTKPIIVPPQTTEETEIPTEKPVPKPTETITQAPATTEAPKPPVTTTPKVTTPATPAPTNPPEPEPTQAPDTEPPVVIPPVTEEPEETDLHQNTTGTSGRTSSTKRTEPDTETDTDSTEQTTDETSEAETTGDMFTGKKMFSSPLEVVSFILGIFVIIFVYLTLFTVARRIVKKYTKKQ